MFTYKKNPYVKGETLIMHPHGHIHARLHFNDFASEYNEPEEMLELSASDMCDALNASGKYTRIKRNEQGDAFVAGCAKCGSDVYEINEKGLCNECANSDY